jgi:hypothetical protein
MNRWRAHNGQQNGARPPACPSSSALLQALPPLAGRLLLFRRLAAPGAMINEPDHFSSERLIHGRRARPTLAGSDSSRPSARGPPCRGAAAGCRPRLAAPPIGRRHAGGHVLAGQTDARPQRGRRQTSWAVFWPAAAAQSVVPRDRCEMMWHAGGRPPIGPRPDCAGPTRRAICARAAEPPAPPARQVGRKIISSKLNFHLGPLAARPQVAIVSVCVCVCVCRFESDGRHAAKPAGPRRRL